METLEPDDVISETLILKRDKDYKIIYIVGSVVQPIERCRSFNLCPIVSSLFNLNEIVELQYFTEKELVVDEKNQIDCEAGELDNLKQCQLEQWEQSPYTDCITPITLEEYRKGESIDIIEIYLPPRRKFDDDRYGRIQPGRKYVEEKARRYRFLLVMAFRQGWTAIKLSDECIKMWFEMECDELRYAYEIRPLERELKINLTEKLFEYLCPEAQLEGRGQMLCFIRGNWLHYNGSEDHLILPYEELQIVVVVGREAYQRKKKNEIMEGDIVYSWQELWSGNLEEYIEYEQRYQLPEEVDSQWNSPSEDSEEQEDVGVKTTGIKKKIQKKSQALQTKQWESTAQRK